MATVLVTGGSGFIGGHMILKLLEQGHAVRTTLRDVRREGDVRATLHAAGQPTGTQLRCFAADLMADVGWPAAIAGCDVVLHVASPFPAAVPNDADSLIVPAREGTLRVLRTARDAGVKRVVLTSSFAAIGYGHGKTDRQFTEQDWTNVDAPDVQPYMKSKTLAERAAWNFIATEGGGLELAVVNPVGVFGPLLGPQLSSSVALIKRLLTGLPAVPRICFGVVDVRDVVDLHLRVMQADLAKGERFLATTDGVLSLLQIATILRDRLGVAARRVPTRQVPDWLVRLLAPLRPEARAILPHLGVKRDATSAKARRLLGWQPCQPQDTIVATAESLLSHGLIG
jgi:nucleoside-diphosphate-sugar epimerase